jgi:hypothetical protein
MRFAFLSGFRKSYGTDRQLLWDWPLLCRLPIAFDLFRKAPFVHLGGAIINTERTNFAEDLCDDGVIRHAGAAHHLHAAIRDPHQRL